MIQFKLAVKMSIHSTKAIRANTKKAIRVLCKSPLAVPPLSKAAAAQIHAASKIIFFFTTIKQF